MKLLFFSDIHGVPSTLEKLFCHVDELNPDVLVLLGDVLYHGPRNGVPGFYDPVKVAELLNCRKDHILAVRGNCDAEVDQMMLNFSIMSDFSEVIAEGKRFFATHGHLWNSENLPSVKDSFILVHGHTHIPECRKVNDDVFVFNPGSLSLPKNQFPQSFGFFADGDLSVRRLDNGTTFMRSAI